MSEWKWTRNLEERGKKRALAYFESSIQNMHGDSNEKLFKLNDTQESDLYLLNTKGNSSLSLRHWITWLEITLRGNVASPLPRVVAPWDSKHSCITLCGARLVLPLESPRKTVVESFFTTSCNSAVVLPEPSASCFSDFTYTPTLGVNWQQLTSSISVQDRGYHVAFLIELAQLIFFFFCSVTVTVNFAPNSRQPLSVVCHMNKEVDFFFFWIPNQSAEPFCTKHRIFPVCIIHSTLFFFLNALACHIKFQATFDRELSNQLRHSALYYTFFQHSSAVSLESSSNLCTYGYIVKAIASCFIFYTWLLMFLEGRI